MRIKLGSVRTLNAMQQSPVDAMNAGGVFVSKGRKGKALHGATAHLGHGGHGVRQVPLPQLPRHLIVQLLRIPGQLQCETGGLSG